MTTTNLKHAIWLVMAMSAAALAAGPGSGGGGGGGGGGGKPATEATNSLSVPAIMAGAGSTFALTCPATGFSILVPPDKQPPVFYPEACAATKDGGQVCVDAGYYYKQRDAKWQAPCMLSTGSPVDVLGRWGDNLVGDAMLKVGSPIRVELVLWDGAGVAAGRSGYFVIKLEPAELDRLSDYGHLAGGSEAGFFDTPYMVGEELPDGSTFGAIVHDPTARLRIERLVDGVPVSPAVFNGTAGGEINATGKIVYGYNLRVTTAGTYRITYTFTNVNFASNDPDVLVCDAGECIGNEASLDIVVTGGGGGGKPVKPPK